MLTRLLCALLPAWGPVPAGAAALVVDTLFDADDRTDGKCSLREAITAANLNRGHNECKGTGSFGADTITFAVSGTIQLTAPLPRWATTNLSPSTAVGRSPSAARGGFRSSR